MELALALSPLIAVVGTLGGILLGHVLGQRAARRDRQVALDRSAIADTRDWLLDLLDVFASAADRDWWATWRHGRATRRRRYPHQYVELIADDQLVEELAETLPAAYEALPRVPRELAARAGQIRFVVNRAMLEQERELEKSGRLRIASNAQQLRLVAAAERIEARTRQLRGQSRILFVLRTLVPWP
jgi:hypothetical protein